MALKNCTKCLVDVTDSALQCVECGHQLRRPQRSFFGKLVKWAFILFNIGMAWWLFTGINAATNMMEGSTTAESAGLIMVNSIAAAMITGLWIVGDIILGLFVLFTRPKSSPKK